MVSLEEVYEAIRADKHFDHLRLPGVRLVPGYGATQPKALLVGEAPGATENLRGRPFCGPSGQVLDQLMDMAGLYLDPSPKGLGLAGTVHPNSFVTNVVKYRPPQNRTPNLREILDAQPHLRAEWKALGGPKLIVCVGAVAHNAMHPSGGLMSLSTVVAQPVSTKAGVWFISMYHPAYGLRRESVRPRMEEHWDFLGDFIKKEGLLA